jgi:hypothetical protein
MISQKFRKLMAYRRRAGKDKISNQSKLLKQNERNAKTGIE